MSRNMQKCAQTGTNVQIHSFTVGTPTTKVTVVSCFKNDLFFSFFFTFQNLKKKHSFLDTTTTTTL